MVKTVEEVVADFRARGISVAEWSRQNQVSASSVYQVLKGKHMPLRGQSHRIAVLLGIKIGIIDSQ